MITGTNPFTVTSSHTFKSFQNIDLVTITIVNQNGRTATGIDRVVNPPAVLEVQTAGLSVTANKAFVGTLATFTDTGAAESASDFRATITLGKRHKVTGTITGSNGQFVVSSKLPFSRVARSEKVVVTVTDLLDGQSVTESETVSRVRRHPRAKEIRHPVQVIYESNR